MGARPTHQQSAPGPVKMLFLLLLALVAAVASPAPAHEEHRRQQAQQAHVATQAANAAATSRAAPQELHAEMGEMMADAPPPRAEMSFVERFLDWLGRFHPLIVHFPIAFFPAALFTAIVGRRRPAFGAPVQFLVVAGGILAPISAILGWLNGGWTLSDSDPLMAVHRWLGTAIGIGGLVLAIWAWRRPWEDRGAGMIAALSAMTAAIVIQGWYGGALVHGIGHLNW